MIHHVSSLISSVSVSAWTEFAPSLDDIRALTTKYSTFITTSIKTHYEDLKETTLNSGLDNITVNATKEDIDAVISSVLDKLSEECKDGGCSYTARLKTHVEQTFRKKININILFFNN